MKATRVLSFFSVFCLWNTFIGNGIAFANDPPVITCPVPVDPGVICGFHTIDGGDGIFNLGDLVAGNAVVSDPNGDPLALRVISITHDGQPETPVNAPVIENSGDFSWQTTVSDPEGVWEFCLEVSDNDLADTCCFDVELALKFYLSIRDVTGTTDTISSMSGQDKDVYVNVSPAVPLSEFSAQIVFNDGALYFGGPATPIGDLSDWEYFTYRLSFDTTCIGTAPLGLLSITAVADLDNGASTRPPDSSFGLDGNIVHLRFNVTHDWNVLGQCLPFVFCSVDCDDNRLVSKDGSTEYLPTNVAPECLTGSAIGNVETCNGAICVRDPDPPDCDINLNGIALEIGDVILFSNWFIHGDIVLDPAWRDFQKQAMDCDNDGIVSLADLFYMIRAIAGEIHPFPQGTGGSVDIMTEADRDHVTVSAASASAIGGALLVFQYDAVEVGEPALAQPMPGLTLKSHAANGELRVLLIPSLTETTGVIPAGYNALLDIPFEGVGNIELNRIELVDASGEVLPGRILGGSAHPSSYALLQNYPNPFNAGTVIPFNLQDASEWELTIYNIVGQEVRAFRGVSGASRVEVYWDGANRAGQQVASGMYFYRVRAGDFVASRKMILLK